METIIEASITTIDKKSILQEAIEINYQSRRQMRWFAVVLFIFIGLVLFFNVFFICYMCNKVNEDFVSEINTATDSVRQSVTDVLPNEAADKFQYSEKYVVTKDVNAAKFFTSDYLVLIVPIIMAIAGFIVGFLGLNKLKNIDDEMRKMKEELYKSSDREMNSIREYVEKRLDLIENRYPTADTSTTT